MEEMTQEEIKEFYKKFDIIDKSVHRILGILESDEKIKEKGLVEKVSLMSRQLSELLTREKIYKAKATTWGVIGGAVGTALVWLFKLIITKVFII